VTSASVLTRESVAGRGEPSIVKDISKKWIFDLYFRRRTIWCAFSPRSGGIEQFDCFVDVISAELEAQSVLLPSAESSNLFCRQIECSFESLSGCKAAASHASCMPAAVRP
jgi:hypothetical protein